MSISSILSGLLGKAAASPIQAIGNVLDKLFTSDAERLDKKILMQRLVQRPHELQAEINKIEAGHRSWFVAGWRPAIGWIGAFGLGFIFIVNPLIAWFKACPGPQVPEKALFDLILALLGVGTLRTIEKARGISK